MTALITHHAFLASLPAPLTRLGRDCASVPQVAKRVRHELALAIGTVLPADTKVSVRVVHHTSINIDVTEWHGEVFSPEYELTLWDPSIRWEERPRWHEGWGRHIDSRHSVALGDALVLIERIANRHNFDRSQIEVDYFDVGYYLTVAAGPVEAVRARGIRMEHDQKFRALCDRAEAVAVTLDKRVLASVLGPGGLAAAGEWTMNRLIRVAEQGTSLVYDKRRRGWVPQTNKEI